MPYDFDACDRSPPVHRDVPPMDPRDLEALVTLLELAAIELTPRVDSTFTREELVAMAKEYGGDECPIRDEEIDLVLPGCKFIVKAGERLVFR